MHQDQLDQEEKERFYHRIFDSASDVLMIIDMENGYVIEANPAANRMHGYSPAEFIGLKLETLVQPSQLRVLREYLEGIKSNNVSDIRIKHVRQDGSTFIAEWRGTAFNVQNRSCVLGVIRDVSKRIQTEELLHQRVKTRTHEQIKLLEISHILASTLEFQPGLILNQLREIIEFTQGGLFALKDSTLVALAMRGTQRLEQSLPFSIHLRGPEMLAALFNGHRPIRISDIWSDDPPAQFLRSFLEDGAAVLLEGMQSWMWVPLAVKGRIIGGLGVAETRKNFFTSHHADLALSVANQAAITMINAELYGRAQALAVLEERQRLAHNLHDAVNQSLFSAGLIAEVLPRLWDRDQEEAWRSIEDLRRLTRGALAEMRALLAELRPSTLTDSNLPDLLQLLGNALTGRTNIPVEISVSGEFFLPAEVQVAFYRICQEALYNIAKHSKASQVEIHLTQEGSIINLRIHDNGQGFDPSQTFPGHYGLDMMRERASAVGAVFSVISQPGHGTELILSWIKTSSKEGSR